MALETQFNNIGDLNPAWPLNTDPIAEGAAQIRGIKSSLQGNVNGTGTQTVLYNGSLNKANGAALLTLPEGLIVRDSRTAQASPVLYLDTSGNVHVFNVSRTPSLVQLVAMVSGEKLDFVVTTPAGVRIGLSISGVNGAPTLYVDGVVTFEANPLGVKVVGNTPQVEFASGAGVNYGAIFATATGPLVVRGLQGGGVVELDHGTTARLRTQRKSVV